MRVGFACAYTPLALLDAAGAEPFRVLPLTAAPERAAEVLHDNLCPHVKRVLDRVIAGDLPALDGVVLMNSCDAMRRLADAWRQVRPADRLVLLELPVAPDAEAIAWFAGEHERLRDVIGEWTGAPIGDAKLASALARWNTLAGLAEELAGRRRRGTLSGGAAEAQRVYNALATAPVQASIEALRALLTRPEPPATDAAVPVLLFGNVLPDPEVLAWLERSGLRIAADDLCTGARLLYRVEPHPGEPVLAALARASLTRPTACARTVTLDAPGTLGERVVRAAREAGARGVIGHVVKFCDPYLARLPAIRRACAQAGLPLLVLEGDCTLRTAGQQSTRVEAFVEMLRA